MKTLIVVAILSVIVCGSAFHWSKPELLNIYPELHGVDKPEQKIIGGEEAIPNSLPYQVYIYSGFIWCGGSLISSEYVLTAAHCTDDMFYVNVVLGAHNIKTQEKTQQSITIYDKDIIIHENWSPETDSNDIALIKLPDNFVQLNEYVQPIRLPTESQKDQTFEFEKVMTSGWGFISDMTVPPTLRYVESIAIPNLMCSIFFSNIIIQDAHICMSSEDKKTACNGDSGGPLVISEEDNEKTLIGILSFVRMPCEISWAVGCTRVTSYLDWIAEKTNISIRP